MRVRQIQDVGPLLKSVRAEQHLSQDQLGARIGLSQERISKIEAHPERVTLDNLFTVFTALGIELDLTPKKTVGSANDTEHQTKKTKVDW